jgi:prepilin-type N-terminal cleavage/methylation domain-containing protein/prepilin-type processing-associated H-X9-DG protein
MEISMKTKAGFTLIELLVVIGIIAILSAILFPVFAKAREKARQTTCSSNQRQIGLALMQYVEDYDETLPNRQNANGTNWKVYLNSYIKAKGIWVCPSNPSQGNTDADGTSFAPGYAANTANGTPVDQPFVDINTASPVSLAQLQQPSSTIGIVEFEGIYSDYRVTSTAWNLWDSPGSLMFAGHTGHANFLFMDGHVKAMRPMDTLDKQDGGAADTNMWTNDGASFTSMGASTADAKGVTDLSFAQNYSQFN